MYMKVLARRERSIHVVTGEWGRQESHSCVHSGSDTRGRSHSWLRCSSPHSPRPNFTDLSLGVQGVCFA